MIRKLRRKFIWINMTLVTLVLLIVFGAIFYSTYRHLEQASLRALEREAHADGTAPPKFELGTDIGQRKEPGAANLPVFSVTVDEAGVVLELRAGMVNVEEESIFEAVDQVLASGQAAGILRGQNLRYLVRQTPSGMRIAFADRSDELASLRTLFFSSLLIGAGGLAAFFGISVFLAGWALRPVERAWNRQRQFVADASHELKTPLTVILANTQILLSHKESTVRDQLKWVEHTQTEAVRMKKMVEDMLFLAKSDASPSEPDRLPMDLSDLVTATALSFEPVAFEQGVQLSNEIAENIEICGDASQLTQLAVILLDNACKYAGESGRVRLTLQKTGEKAVLAVQNSGTPIPPEHLPHLFERFYRTDGSRARTQGGYGLGLAIADQIVRGHHGKIAVTSDEESGTVFTVLLPIGR